METLGYNEENDRFGLLLLGLWVNDGLHCGECLEVNISGEWVQTRIERDGDGEWYLVGTPCRGAGLEYLPARLVPSSGGTLRG